MDLQHSKDIVACDHVYFSYHQSLILHDVSLRVKRGDFAVVIGGNGTGKSTLMKILLNELQPLRGEVRLFGEKTGHLTDWSRIGYLPQNAISRNQSFPASVAEIVRAHLYQRRKRERLSRAEVSQLALHALDQVGMLEYADRQVGRLSGGQQQRVMIAGILAAKPELMLLDEPTAGIDYQAMTSLFKLLEELRIEHELTLLLITHDVVQIADYANRIFCLESGTVVELEPEQLKYENQHRHAHPHPDQICAVPDRTDDSPAVGG